MNGERPLTAKKALAEARRALHDIEFHSSEGYFDGWAFAEHLKFMANRALNEPPPRTAPEPGEGLREALERIAHLTGDMPAAYGNAEEWYRQQFHVAVGTAARALAAALARTGGSTMANEAARVAELDEWASNDVPHDEWAPVRVGTWRAARSTDHEHHWTDADDDETGWHCRICDLTEYPGDPGIGEAEEAEA